MPVSKAVRAMTEKSSWIRKMFEEGARLKEEAGAENVCDFTLGNPMMEPPDEVIERIRELSADTKPGAHRYMPNAGIPAVRDQIAEYLDARSGLRFTRDHIVMTVGAGGALNVIIKALVDPGDEVVTLAPYFPEYAFYASNHQAKLKIVETDEIFQPDMEKLANAIGPGVRVVLLNSPNNPTGAVYPKHTLEQAGAILEEHFQETGRQIYLVMDEPYRKLVYGHVEPPDIFGCYSHTIVATSHSKDLCLPGERIGYIAISPLIEDSPAIHGAMTMANRILGFVNAPALFQLVVAGLQDCKPDMTVYSENRRILTEGLSRIGYELVEPGGGFYLFPRSPIDDDIAFVKKLKRKNILVAPGAGFGRPGYFRIAFCCSPATCRKALAGFGEVYKSLPGG